MITCDTGSITVPTVLFLLGVLKLEQRLIISFKNVVQNKFWCNVRNIHIFS